MDPFIDPIFYKYFEEYPLALFDVGAAGAIRKPWQNASKYLRVYASEPSTRAKDIQGSGDVNVNIIPVGLSNKSGQVQIFQTKNPDNSSLLQPSDCVQVFGGSERFEVIEAFKITVDTLDHQAEALHIPYVDFIKIDTQGTELDILRGGERVIDKVFGIQVEANFHERYVGQAYFSDIDTWLRECGFLLVDLERRYLKMKDGIDIGGPKGMLVKGDALYIRYIVKPEHKADLEGVFGKEWKKITLLHQVSIAILYGYMDIAHHIYQKSREILSNDEQVAMNRFFEKQKYFSRIPRFPGRVRLSKFFDYLSRKLQYRSKIGSSGDSGVGNI